MFLEYKMSLLKWQEMAKSKSALGKKINFVHNAITQKKLGDETSQIGFEKMFKPITSKLDESIASNLGLLPRAKPAKKKKAKLEGIDYFPDVDPFEDMDVEGLFDETAQAAAPVPPQSEKQISTIPTYEEIIQEIGDDDPPEYTEDETPDYALKPEDEVESESETVDEDEYLRNMNILSYTTVQATLNSQIMSATQKRNFLRKSVLPDAIRRRDQLKGYKTSWTKKFKRGAITEEQKNIMHERINNSFKVLNRYIRYYQGKAEQMTGSGVRRRKKGGTVRFFSNPKELLQKLEVIIGSILAGNTNVSIRNTGVGILDLLLKENAINKSQHEKLFRKYFKP